VVTFPPVSIAGSVPVDGIGVVYPGDPTGRDAFAHAERAVSYDWLVGINYFWVSATHSRPDKTDTDGNAGYRKDIAGLRKRTFCLSVGDG